MSPNGRHPLFIESLCLSHALSCVCMSLKSLGYYSIIKHKPKLFSSRHFSVQECILFFQALRSATYGHLRI